MIRSLRNIKVPEVTARQKMASEIEENKDKRKGERFL